MLQYIKETQNNWVTWYKSNTQRVQIKITFGGIVINITCQIKKKEKEREREKVLPVIVGCYIQSCLLT